MFVGFYEVGFEGGKEEGASRQSESWTKRRRKALRVEMSSIGWWEMGIAACGLGNSMRCWERNSWRTWRWEAREMGRREMKEGAVEDL